MAERKITVSVVVLLLAAFAAAGSAFAGPETRLDLDKLAGVYKYRYAGAMINPEPLQYEDVLEIVKYSPTAAYFRVVLDFRKCDLSGIATVEDNALVFRPYASLYKSSDSKPEKPMTMDDVRKELDDKRKITFRLIVADGAISLKDDGRQFADATCQDSSAEYGDSNFTLKDRHDIRYMKRLLASQEYQEAVDEYKGTLSNGGK